MKFDFLKPEKMNSLIKSGKSLAGVFFPQRNEAKTVTVCDLSRSSIILLEASRTPDGSLCIQKFEYIQNTFQDQRPALLLKPFFEANKFSKSEIRAAIESYGVVVRFIRFPKMKLEDLSSAMKYEIDQYVPFEIKDCVLDYAVVEENVKTPEGEKIEVMLVVVKRQELEPMLEVFRSLECKLSVVDMDILAAMSTLGHFFPEDFSGHVGLLDMGVEISTLGIVRDGKPRFVRDISYGTYDMKKRLRINLNLSAEEVENLLEKNEVPSPALSAGMTESLEGLIGDLKVSFDYYRDQSHFEKPIQKLFVSRGGAFHPAVLKALSDGLGIPVVGLDVLSKIKWADTVDAEQLRKHAAFLPIPLGLVLRSE